MKAWERFQAEVSVTLYLVCAECREGLSTGDIYLSSGHRPEAWGIEGDLERGIEGATEYFLLAHRGHVLSLIDEFALDMADAVHDPFWTTSSIDELHERHPLTELEDVEDLAPASMYLRPHLVPSPPGE
jgi:hypothetical protein